MMDAQLTAAAGLPRDGSGFSGTVVQPDNETQGSAQTQAHRRTTTQAHGTSHSLGGLWSGRRTWRRGRARCGCDDGFHSYLWRQRAGEHALGQNPAKTRVRLVSDGAICQHGQHGARKMILRMSHTSKCSCTHTPDKLSPEPRGRTSVQPFSQALC